MRIRFLLGLVVCCGCAEPESGFLVSVGIADQELGLANETLSASDWAGSPVASLADAWSPPLGLLEVPLEPGDDGTIGIEGGVEIVDRAAFGPHISSQTRLVSEVPEGVFRLASYLRESAEAPSVALFSTLSTITVRVEWATCLDADAEWSAEVEAEGPGGDPTFVVADGGIGWQSVRVEAGGTDLVEGLDLALAVYPSDGCPAFAPDE